MLPCIPKKCFFSIPSYQNKPNHILPTDTSLFTSMHDSDSEETKENGTSGVKSNAIPKQVPTGAGVGGGGGLFDEDDEDDDFFSDRSLKKTDSG